MQILTTDLLIVGSGPAGGSLAAFLAEYGLKGIVVSATPGTADTPRAHITNMAALECLRDIGLEDECLRQATHNGCMEHTRWCHSMAGEEYARVHSWGHDPHRVGDYADASPCQHVDLPQTLLEPIMINRARSKGFDVRFNTTLLAFADTGKDGVVCEVQNNLSGDTYQIRSRYLFGCDGGKSTVMRQLGIPLNKQPGQGLAINVLIEADLTDLMKTRSGNLHWTIQPTEEYPDFGWMGLVRMVRPWHEWMFILFTPPGFELKEDPPEEEYLKRCKEFIGDDSIDAKIKNISRWYINEVVAERYSVGNVFALGDAVHRHPPFNGLGSNTCVQDAYNLAWKIAHVMQNKAGPSLLDSYSSERQPVGLGVVTRANQGFREHSAIWEALGMTEETLEQRKQAFAELKAATTEGVERRKRFRTAIEGTAREFHAVGQEMNQLYESDAIYLQDEEGHRPAPSRDPVLYHQISTYPGSRLPHAWLNTRVPGKQISTHDLAGHGRFAVFTGVGGDAWRTAAEKVSKDLGCEIVVLSIGWQQDYEDVYFDWEKRREVGEAGCILVRPDRFIAWRCRNMLNRCEGKLAEVMKTILGRQG